MDFKGNIVTVPTKKIKHVRIIGIRYRTEIDVENEMKEISNKQKKLESFRQKIINDINEIEE